MISLAIEILEFAIGVIIVAACIFLAFWGIRQIVSIPPLIEKLVWVIFGIVCLIFLLIALNGSVGSGVGFRPLFPRSGMIIPGDRIGVFLASYENRHERA
jgi:hypothetical protein